MRVLTQEERALKMLQKSRRHGVKNYDFSNHRILRYGEIIRRLREDGYNIITEREHLKNGHVSNVYIYTLINEDAKENK